MSTKGKGAKFEYGDTTAVFTATTGWTEVGSVTDFDLPESELADIKTTSHSTSGNAHTYQSGLEEPGQSSITSHYDKTVFDALHDLRGAAKNFRIRFSDGSGIGWAGYIKGTPQGGIDLEGLNVMTVKTKVSGEITTIAAIT
jgi:hypothetical protein